MLLKEGQKQLTEKYKFINVNGKIRYVFINLVFYNYNHSHCVPNTVLSILL